MNPWIQIQKAIPLFFITLLIVCFGPSQESEAVTPPPDGGYPNLTTAEGQNALKDLTTGAANTALGAYSLFGTTAGSFNTAVGAGALDLNTGDANTAVGVAALLLNTGTNNTGVGVDALGLNTTGSQNVANGVFALYSNTTGFNNTAIGMNALYSNTIGVGNTANGADALYFNTTGVGNAANGYGALVNNTTGYHNAANGFQALYSNTTGYANTGIGYEALLNCTGAGNTALGYLAGQNLTTGDDNIDIGADGVAGEAGVIRIGRSFINSAYIAGIFDVPVFTGTTPVYVNSVGQLGTAGSSARFKQNIRSMGSESEVLLALHPVSFQYKAELDPKGIPQFGLVAEEVDKVDPDLVIRDAKGKPYSVRYEAVNAMLLSEFLKEHRKVEQQRKDFEAAIAEQHKEIEALTTTVKQQAAQIQKVSAQLEVSKAAPQTVLN